MSFHTKRSMLVAILGLAVLAPSCVMAGQHRQAQDQLALTRDQLIDAENDRRALEDTLVDVDGQRTALQAKASRADQLAAENAALTARVEELKRAKAINPIDGTTFFMQDGKYGYRAQGDVVFSPGSDKLTQQGQKILTNLAEELKKTSYPITVVGHTDADPIKLTADVWTRGNIHLGAHRAMSVLEYLVGKGIPEGRISLQSYGPHRPIASGNSAEAKAKNRRVEVMVGVNETADTSGTN